MQCSIIYSAGQCSAVRFTVQYSTVYTVHNSVWCGAVRYSAEQHSTAQQCSAVYSAGQCSAVLF